MLVRASRRTLLAALGGICAAAPFSAYAEPPSEVPATDEDLSLAAWVDRWGRPAASVLINGAGPFRFLVDTGANTSVVSRRLVDQLGLPVLDAIEINGVTGSARYPMTSIDRLVSGSAERRALRAAVIPETNLFRFDGVMGGDVFAGKKLSFDIPNKRVTLSRGALGPLQRRRPNIRLRNESLVEISGRVGKVSAILMLDTGADECVVTSALARDLIKAHPGILRLDRAEITGVTGQSLAGDYLVLPRVMLGNVNIDRVGAIAADSPIFAVWGLQGQRAMIVGMNVLSRAERFTIDYSARRFDLTPQASIAEADKRPEI